MERCLTIYRNLFASEYCLFAVEFYLFISEVYILFVVMYSPEKKGAPGLLEAVNKASDLAGRKDTKLVGITTDGKSADTGKQAGLWRPLADQVQRGLATF